MSPLHGTRAQFFFLSKNRLFPYVDETCNGREKSSAVCFICLPLGLGLTVSCSAVGLGLTVLGGVVGNCLEALQGNPSCVIAITPRLYEASGCCAEQSSKYLIRR